MSINKIELQGDRLDGQIVQPWPVPSITVPPHLREIVPVSNGPEQRGIVFYDKSTFKFMVWTGEEWVDTVTLLNWAFPDHADGI